MKILKKILLICLCAPIMLLYGCGQKLYEITDLDAKKIIMEEFPKAEIAASCEVPINFLRHEEYNLCSKTAIENDIELTSNTSIFFYYAFLFTCDDESLIGIVPRHVPRGREAKEFSFIVSGVFSQTFSSLFQKSLLSAETLQDQKEVLNKGKVSLSLTVQDLVHESVFSDISELDSAKTEAGENYYISDFYIRFNFENKNVFIYEEGKKGVLVFNETKIYL